MPSTVGDIEMKCFPVMGNYNFISAFVYLLFQEHFMLLLSNLLKNIALVKTAVL